MNNDTIQSQGAQSEQPSKSEVSGPPTDQPSCAETAGTGLPWGFVALAAAGTFLFMQKEKLGSEGSFIYIIAAIVLGILSANMLAGK